MKEVFVLRHGEWNLDQDRLSVAGREAANTKRLALPVFATVLSSPYGRTSETALLLSGMDPEESLLATTPQAPGEYRERIKQERSTHPLGVAGVLFEIEAVRPSLEVAGRGLKRLVDVVLEDMWDEQRALIVSHDGTMLAAERVITGQPFDEPLDHTFGPLQGFRVNQDHELQRVE